jgi:hypothetical protein
MTARKGARSVLIIFGIPLDDAPMHKLSAYQLI